MTWVDQPRDLLGDPRPGEFLGAPCARRAHLFAARGVLEQLDQRVADRDVVLRVDQQAGLAVDHRVDRAADAAGDGGAAVRVGLEVDDPEALADVPAGGHAAGHREDVSAVEPGVALLVADDPEEPDRVFAEADRAGELGGRRAQRAVADHDPLGARNPGGDQGHRPDHHVVALVAVLHAGDRQHRGAVDRLLGRRLLRKVDAGVDQVDPLGGATGLGDETRRVVADGDAGVGVARGEAGQPRPDADLLAVEVLHHGDAEGPADQRRARAHHRVRADHRLRPKGDRLGDRHAVQDQGRHRPRHGRHLLDPPDGDAAFAVELGRAGGVEGHHAAVEPGRVADGPVHQVLDATRGGGEVGREDEGAHQAGSIPRYRSSQSPAASSGQRMWLRSPSPRRCSLSSCAATSPFTHPSS